MASTAAPSEITNMLVPWVWWRAPDRKSRDVTYTGKWILMYRSGEEHDRAWAWFTSLLDDGQFPEIHTAKAATAMPRPTEMGFDGLDFKPIILYCSRSDERVRIIRIGLDILRKAEHLPLFKMINYKTDKQTLGEEPGKRLYRIPNQVATCPVQNYRMVSSVSYDFSDQQVFNDDRTDLEFSLVYAIRVALGDDYAEDAAVLCSVKNITTRTLKRFASDLGVKLTITVPTGRSKTTRHYEPEGLAEDAPRLVLGCIDGHFFADGPTYPPIYQNALIYYDLATAEHGDDWHSVTTVKDGVSIIDEPRRHVTIFYALKSLMRLGHIEKKNI